MSLSDRLKAIGKWLWEKLMAPGVALLVFVGGFILIAVGWKELNVGGLVDRILGRKKEPLRPANTPPPGRVDGDGQPIPLGTPDSTGQVQVPVVPLTPPGIFDDKTQVTVTVPGDKQPTEVKLPTGVEADDVDQVVVIQPTVTQVQVTDKSDVKPSTVKSLLDKYGKR
jgi:hypothetical protein